MKPYRGYLFDLDGTIYLGDRALTGAVETIAKLRAQGARVAFLSNKPIEPAASFAAKLTRLGIPTPPEEVLNSSIVMARYLSRTAPGTTAYLIGEEPLADELRQRSIRLTEDPLAAEYVVVSWDRQFTYKKLNDALQAIRRGARCIATHPDRTCPVDGGEVADVGGMIGAIEGVTGKQVELITGKPSPITVQEAMHMLGLEDPAECIMVGDRLETDMRMGREAGMATALVLTGVTTRDQVGSSPWQPDYVLDGLYGLTEG